MRFIVFIFILFSFSGYSQMYVRNTQILPNQSRDSSYVHTYVNGRGVAVTKHDFRLDIADYDWLKLDGSRLPINSDSIKRSGYTLWTGDNGGFDTKVEILKEGYIQFRNDSFQDDTRWLFKALPNQSGEGNTSFGFTQGSFANVSGTRRNHTYSFGINPLLETGKTGIFYNLEDHYSPDAANKYSESHLIFHDSTGNDYRLQSWTINKDLTNWNVYNQVDLFSIRHPSVAGGTNYARFNHAGVENTTFTLNGTSSGEGVQFDWNTASDFLTLNPVDGTSSTTSGFYVNTGVQMTNKMRVISDWGASFGSDGLATKLWGSEAAVGGGMQSVTIGYGIDLVSNVLKADTAELATQYDIKNNYSTDEQVWKGGTWIGGATIYWRTWSLDDGADALETLTGLEVDDIDMITDARVRYYHITTSSWKDEGSTIEENDNALEVYTYSEGANYYVTLWYTKP